MPTTKTAAKKTAAKKSAATKTAAKKSAVTPDYLTEPRAVLPGSEKEPIASAVLPALTAGEAFVADASPQPASPRKTISVSVIVPPANPIPSAAVAGKHLSRAQFKASHAASPAAVKAVTAFAKTFGLTVTAQPARHTVILTGTVGNMQKAFGVTLHDHKMDDQTYRVRQGSICIPHSLLPHIQAVLGLDNRPQAKPHFRVRSGERASGTSYTPPQIAALYGFPSGAKATGQTIGIIELGGGYKPADITTYFKSIGVTAPTVTAVLVDGAKNAPTTASSADGEVLLDIEVAGAVAPGAKIVVYFTPNTDQGFVDAITTATNDTKNKPSIISISWGGPESSWTKAAMTSLDNACKAAAAVGITVTVAAGDDGSSDGVKSGNHVDFPASSPNVLACGGTKLVGSGTAISSEVVWNETAANEGATGGGISTMFPQPSYQSGISATAKGRGVPDVAGDADPSTGYQVRVDGGDYVYGGTSAVAPLWAGLIALSNAANKNTAGLPHAKLYATAGQKAFHDITSGNNGAYKAAKGWDPCTGLGSPIGTSIVSVLATKSTTKKGKKAKA